MEELTSWNSYYFAGKAYLKINSLVKTPLHEWQLNDPGYGLLAFATRASGKAGNRNLE